LLELTLNKRFSFHLFVNFIFSADICCDFSSEKAASEKKIPPDQNFSLDCIFGFNLAFSSHTQARRKKEKLLGKTKNWKSEVRELQQMVEKNAISDGYREQIQRMREWCERSEMIVRAPNRPP